MNDESEIVSTEGIADLSARSGFFRVDPGPARLPAVGDGPRWTLDEADARAHDFLAALVGERSTVRHADPVVHARENALLLMFGEPERAAFETLLARMPRERAQEWLELLSGGATSEAFGPLTLQERLDERQVEVSLVQGRRQRAINLLLAATAIVVLAIGGAVAYRALTDDEQRTEGTLRFDPIPSSQQAAVTGGVPVAVAELTASLSTVVAVEPGGGDAAARIVNVPFAVLPQPPGALRASVFDFGGSGQVAVVGPPDWLLDPTCLRASVVSAELRALDTVHWESTPGACHEPVGRSADPPCVGTSAVLLDVEIPAGPVDLPEGGTALADAVRVQLVAPPTDEYEVLTIRGLIAVPVGSETRIPRFGGAVGDELQFDLGADRSGTCTIGAASVVGG